MTDASMAELLVAAVADELDRDEQVGAAVFVRGLQAAVRDPDIDSKLRKRLLLVMEMRVTQRLAEERAKDVRAEQEREKGQEIVPKPGDVLKNPGLVMTQGQIRASLDPWAHRSDQMRCRTCMYFVGKAGGNDTLGRCRRHAPTLSGFPAVFVSDWCGDHKIDETKAG